MKISSIRTNQQSFNKMYVSANGIQKQSEYHLFDLIKKVYVSSDAIDYIDKLGVDMYIYPNSGDNGKSFKIAFADNNQKTYKLSENAYCHIYKDNPFPVLGYIDSIIKGKINEKSADNETSKEIKQIFNKEKEENIYIFG